MSNYAKARSPVSRGVAKSWVYAEFSPGDAIRRVAASLKSEIDPLSVTGFTDDDYVNLAFCTTLGSLSGLPNKFSDRIKMVSRDIPEALRPYLNRRYDVETGERLWITPNVTKSLLIGGAAGGVALGWLIAALRGSKVDTEANR